MSVGQMFWFSLGLFAIWYVLLGGERDFKFVVRKVRRRLFGGL